jgi:hypothetical protein
MYIQQAKDILKIDDYFLHNPGLYADYFLLNMEAEDKLKDSQKKQLYFAHKKDYGLARQRFEGDETEDNAKSFLKAHEQYAEFKRSNGFPFGSLEEYYQSNIIEPTVKEQAIVASRAIATPA